jgi:DNA-directed RNA polymerase specialized sigma24 family protein
MEDIPDVYKEVLIMRFVDGLGPKEMSELTEEKENVISVRIHRGLKLLRKKIEAQDEFADEKRKAAARKKAADKK